MLTEQIHKGLAVLVCSAWLAVLSCVNLAGADGAAPERDVLELSGETMASTYVVKLVDCKSPPEELEKIGQEFDSRLKEINRQLSHYMPESDLSRFGRSPAQTPFKIAPEFAEVMRMALDLNKKTGGLFDPSIGPLIDLWGFGPKGKRQEPPSEKEIEAIKKTVGVQHLKLTASNELIKDIPDLKLNLGSITKGYAAREMARILLAHNVTNFYVAISGEVYVHGYGPAGPEWRIGIDEPFFDSKAGENVRVVLRLTNSALSTSGNYRKYFRAGEKQVYSHISDPQTGRPTTNQLASVTVLTSSSDVADGLATAAYLLGPERGLQFIEETPGASAFFIVRNADGTFRRFASKRFPSYELKAEK